MGVFIDDLLGLSYKVGGRDKSGFDCYGLAIEVLRRFGFEMSDLFTTYKKEDTTNLLTENYQVVVKKDSLLKKENAEEGDILLFYDDKGRACHLGVFLKNDSFIHCDSLGVRISKLSTYLKKAEVYTWHE